MAKFTDFVCTKDVNDMMERLVETYPNDFPGFDVDAIQGVYTRGKKPSKASKACKLHAIRYPQNVLIDEKVYFVELNDEVWKTYSETKKQRAIYHIMCQIPEGAFDDQNDNYGKKVKPDSAVFIREHQRNNGCLTWENDDSHIPPLIPAK